jgi:hypothetical protein
MLLFFEKLIFPTMSKAAEFGQKTQGILGINDIWIKKLNTKKHN